MQTQDLDYQTFLNGKRLVVPSVGIEVAPDSLHSEMKMHQRMVTAWAIRKGRAAVWLDTGLGKSLVALQWAQTYLERGLVERVLIFAPLSVAQQFVREGEKWGIPAVYAHSDEDAPAHGIVTTNYERLDRFDPDNWPGVILDESSVLKNFSGKTKRELIKRWRGTAYKLCLTATPAPNDVVELCNHADFLEIMPQQEMLSRFFTPKGADNSASGQYRLKGHARRDFYRWLSSWAMACKRPSDLGFADDGYLLPPLEIRAEFVEVDWAPAGHLFLTELKGVTQRAQVRRETIGPRVERAASLVAQEPEEQWLLWYGYLDEAEALAKAIPGSIILQGKDTAERKDDVLSAFSRGEVKRLITHGGIAGFGMNFQACARQAFVGLSDSYELYYQAIRRSWRFGQTRPVHAYIVLSEPERAVYENVLRKEREAGELTRELVAAMRDFERAELHGKQDMSDPYEPTQPIRLPAWLRSYQQENAA